MFCYIASDIVEKIKSAVVVPAKPTEFGDLFHEQLHGLEILGREVDEISCTKPVNLLSFLDSFVNTYG